MKNRWTKRRETAILSLGGVCVSCGSTENLEFDHIDPNTKEFTLAAGSGFSEERFSKELAKCQLLCVSCHKLKHRAPHGTLARKRDCNCSLCKEAWNTWNREYKRRRRQAKNIPL
jgi:5-methylcytosine-specific restriction endonuclease McrA